MQAPRTDYLILTFLCWLLIASPGKLLGQAPSQPNSRIEELLVRAGLGAARHALQLQSHSVRGTVEAHVRLESAPPSNAPATALLLQEKPSGYITFLNRKSFSESRPRAREDELAADRLVVAATDAQGNLLDWMIVPDPRIVRSEHPGPDGVLTGNVFYRSGADLLVPFPDDPALSRIIFYVPRWTGEDWTLDLLGTTGIR